MRTLRQAAELLVAANTAPGRVALAAALGFPSVALAVDADSCRRLGIPDDASDAEIIRGIGALRVLLVVAPPSVPLRTFLGRLAAQLDARTTHVLWVVVATSRDGNEIAIACWTRAPRGPRVVALVVQTNRALASDAETLCALAASREGDDLLVHARWCDLLGREALSKRFYRVLEQRVHALADSLRGPSPADRAELALLCVSRLLFLSFLEAKGWLNDDRVFLARHFDACMASGGAFHRRVLLPLFFGTLNTPHRDRAAVARAFGAIPFLNGGLFARSVLEKRHSPARFADDAIGSLFGDLLGAFHFTAREAQDEWAEAAIDPEMLGRAFESLMASRERRTSGAFYTPQAMVAHVADRALRCALAGDGVREDDVAAALDGVMPSSAMTAALRARLRHFTVLDPACGSGAFLVHVLERLADLHRLAGDARSMAAIRRDVLARAIHGVDVNPTAVWLCELRLWLSVVIESDETRMSAVPPLPNLDCNVRVGDTLAGDAFTEPSALVGPSTVLTRLRERYVRAAGVRKAPLRRALAREERLRALAAIDRELAALANARREALRLHRATDLFGESRRTSTDARAEMRVRRLRSAALRRERRRIADGGALPFSFPSHFGAAHARGGFDLVVGNPPWVRLHNIASSARAGLRARYAAYRNAAWDHAPDGESATRSFAAQVDLASLFVERSVELAKPDGCVALLLPAKLWRSLSGGGVRRLLAERTQVRLVEDWTEAPAFFDAAVYPSVVIASRARGDGLDADVAVRKRSLEIAWRTAPESIRLARNDAASPWLLLPPDVRAAFDRIAIRGHPLSASAFGRAMLGVKCGCNDAFMVDAIAEHDEKVSVQYQGRSGVIERDLLRPLLRGDAVTPWSIAPSRSAIVWTHEEAGAPRRTLPVGAARWLATWRRQLGNRTDLRGSRVWWTLFRTEGADSTRPRVVWSDFGRAPRAAMLAAGDPTVPLNSCYVVRCDDVRDALALTALLNTPVAAAWLNAIAEPARGGWHRYLAWTMSLLPLPRDWSRARDILAPIAERALLGDKPSDDDLLLAACHAYRLRRSHVAPLIAWCHTPTST